jgi:uncharacterized protein (DUF1697 family)
MASFIVLLRGINVGSMRKLPMTALRDLCSSLGLQRPETYIQSGNLIVDARGGADELRGLLEKAVAKRFGFAADIIVRPASAWRKHVVANPFAVDEAGLSRMVHLYLSRGPINADAAKLLAAKARTGERLQLAGGALWIDYGANGVGKSKLTPAFIDTACGSPTTGRNWNTALKLLEMIEARR